ncbi:hypothetical protein EUTSA_v10012198mg [Eutrema salsugineum]|uniref:Reverse transcriptase domain-containing protein n=1 Tax=Eutrema salsugineum TaxID=72664 RepID=V4KTP8_EUTSA|nr:hypothetical protein EUTSA_v10012198mg [Eutrema salsugineum]
MLPGILLPSFWFTATPFLSISFLRDYRLHSRIDGCHILDLLIIGSHLLNHLDDRFRGFNKFSFLVLHYRIIVKSILFPHVLQHTENPTLHMFLRMSIGFALSSCSLLLRCCFANKFPDKILDKTQLQRFLGNLNYVLDFCPKINRITKPLHSRLKKNPVPWTKEHTALV